jgi:hypothetical protein
MLRRNLGVDWGDEDELLARVLITSWTLATGRTLSFWADDLIAIP